MSVTSKVRELRESGDNLGQVAYTMITDGSWGDAIVTGPRSFERFVVELCGMDLDQVKYAAQVYAAASAPSSPVASWGLSAPSTADEFAVASEASLAYHKPSGNQTSISDNDAVAFDAEMGSIGNRISYSAANDQFTLAAGAYYTLEAHVAITGTGEAASFQWYDVTGEAAVGQVATARATDDDAVDSTQPVAFAVVAPEADNVYELRKTTGDDTTVVAAGTFARVETFGV